MTEADVTEVALELDERFMRDALDEAALAQARGEVPVGAVVVLDGQIIGRGHNLRETLQDPSAHAELIAIRQAAGHVGSWRLEGATIYVTLEPCPMCAGALVNSRMQRVVFGAFDPKAGATNTLYNIGTDPRLNHRFALRAGVLEAECGQVLTSFFSAIRGRRRAEKEAERARAGTAADVPQSADEDQRGGGGGGAPV